MPIKVKFDPILGRLREGCDCDPEPTVPDLLATTTPSANQTYLADEVQSPGMTVVVTLAFRGTPVDADATPQGWTRTATSEVRSLTAVYPAYWGIYPGNDTTGDISSIVAALKDQHRETHNVGPTVVTVDNPTGSPCWLWIVTRGTAKATPEAFDVSMMDDPATGKTFTSPMPGANWSLSGYKAYVSINRADAGLSFGPVKLTINL